VKIVLRKPSFGFRANGELSRNPGNVTTYRVAGNFQSLDASGARMRGAIRSRNLIHDLAGTRLTPPGAVNDFNDTGVE